MATKKGQANYPRMIYKEGCEAKVVQSPYEHAEYIEKGWGGPAIFDDAIDVLKKKIEDREAELKQMKVQLEQMERAAAPYSGVKKK